jgi:hypothetical protein
LGTCEPVVIMGITGTGIDRGGHCERPMVFSGKWHHWGGDEPS